MSNIPLKEIQRLRQRTGAGIMDCKQALKSSKGQFDQAVDWLRKKGIATANKKSDRTARQGSVSAYIHADGRIGVLLEVNSETDFVARNESFKTFVKELSLHITAMNPLYIQDEDIPKERKTKEQQVFKEQAQSKAKDPSIIHRISEGLYKKWRSEVCLLDQEFVKEKAEQKETVRQALNKLIAKTGENIVIRRFVRFALGETESRPHKSSESQV